jgi:phosphoglucomutase
MAYMETYQKWLNSSALSDAEKAELQSIAQDPKEIESRFFGLLEFGTAGLRGTMAVGLNRMNIHVIRHTTQAFAEVIKAEGAEAMERGVVVCYDCRNNSPEFARETARVMAGNGIKVKLFDALRPTPELSFAVRTYHAQAGVNITASHNPKEYNGYKVYWEDGAQLPPNHASAIAAKMNELDVFDSVKLADYDEAVKSGMITLIGDETDELFLSNVMAQVNDPESVKKVADDFSIIFTPFHGTGYKLIPEALKRMGMKHVICVPEQMVLDGNFPTVVSPNPENPEGFAIAVEMAKKENVSFIMGSDPDADRIGIMVRDASGEFITITGNQNGVILLDYLIGALKRSGKMPANPVVLKSLVSTEMARKVAEANGVQCFDTFTGFKFLAEKKNQLEESGEGKVIMSFEESYGYMFGDFVRDKDAVTAAMVLAEAACYYATQGKTMYDALQDCYAKYGYYREKTVNIVMPGLDGMVKMKEIMASLRQNPLNEVAGVKVVEQKDYQDGSVHNTVTGADTTMELSGSNVLRYELEDGTSFIIRPSGTEPKIKVYILASGADQADADAKVARYAAFADTIGK